MCILKGPLKPTLDSHVPDTTSGFSHWKVRDNQFSTFHPIFETMHVSYCVLTGGTQRCTFSTSTVKLKQNMNPQLLQSDLSLRHYGLYSFIILE